MIVIIDNYDSFTHNLARYFEELGESVTVVRNDAWDVDRVLEAGAEAIVLSPGPGRPEGAGVSVELVRRAPGNLPILGVCLGQQAIAVAHGGTVERGAAPVHGKLADVHHDGDEIFAGLPSPFTVTRYHSLVVSPAGLPGRLRALAWTRDGTMMALRVRRLPVWGVQFHPEALLTEHGHALLANFLALSRGRPAGRHAGLPTPEAPTRIR